MSTESDFWAQHLEAIASEGIYTKGYADREGLDVSKLYQWRKRLSRNKTGSSTSVKPAVIPDAGSQNSLRQFIRINALSSPTRFGCQLEFPSGLQLNLSAQPGPQSPQTGNWNGL